MGPRSETVVIRAPGGTRRGRKGFNGSTVREPWLCPPRPGRVAGLVVELQWVHGPRTVVIGSGAGAGRAAASASMGPRSENRGYPGNGACDAGWQEMLQWVHGPRTVVIWGWIRPTSCRHGHRFNGSTVREPWLSRSGYAATAVAADTLQWVHGPRTVVIRGEFPKPVNFPRASLQWVHGPRTVVISRMDRPAAGRLRRLQWVHGPRTVVMLRLTAAISASTVPASMGPRSENRGYLDNAPDKVAR